MRRIPSVRQPMILAPTVDSLAQQARVTQQSIDDRLSTALPSPLQDGAVLTINFVSGSNTVRHALERRPIGFISLTGLSLTMGSRDTETIVFNVAVATTGSLVWVF